MTKVLILGAGGRIARHAVASLAESADVEQTLFLRNPAQLTDVPANARVLAGDVLDHARLEAAVRGHDLVYANLAGELDQQARTIAASMTAVDVRRLVFVTALGIYDEVPGKFGEWNRRQIGSMLGPYRAAADVIETSGLDYTILRPAWLTDHDEVDFEVTQKGEPFKGTEVSRKSVAALIVGLVKDPSRESGANLGINKPGSDGDKPAFV
ncbi:SDR family oxidoreductase [Rhodococcus sp. NPDC057529]|uniref:SDR family oxidoreductase n=1 Tax=Rhodococcus sp. NPDC057529 TaxID=3346158 RepID=UPI00366AB3FA